MAGKNRHPRTILAPQGQFGGGNRLSRFGHLPDGLPHPGRHGRRNDQVQQIPADGFCRRVSVNFFRRGIPIMGRSIIAIALNGDRRDVFQQIPETPVALAQLFLRLLALGDVIQHRQVFPLIIAFRQRSHAGQNGPARAIFAADLGFQRLKRFAGPLRLLQPGLPGVRDDFPVLGIGIGLGPPIGERRNIILRVAEDRSERPVQVGDVLLPVVHRQRDGRSINDRPVAFFTRGQFRRRPLVFRDVREHGGETALRR